MVSIKESLITNMQQISFFLEKFKTLGLEPVLIKKIFIDNVAKHLHTELPIKCITLKDNTIYITAHPVLKSELYLNKEFFLSEIAKTLGPVKVTNLR